MGPRKGILHRSLRKFLTEFKFSSLYWAEQQGLLSIQNPPKNFLQQMAVTGLWLDAGSYITSHPAPVAPFSSVFPIRLGRYGNKFIGLQSP
jgi:hypothetical protein